MIMFIWLSSACLLKSAIFGTMKYFFLIFLLCFVLGAGGQTYWQQHVATKIEVTLDDNNNTLHAREELVYTNNSPDTLVHLYMHLWPNAYKHDHTPFAKQFELNGNTSFYFAKDADRGYIDSLDFSVDGKSVEHFITEATPDIARIDLVKPLLPGHSIFITTPFMVKIPKVFSRMGHNGQAYFISQWFPKPAVYDKQGWHPISYLEQGEFFSEFGSYDVSITLPANYIVMATGNCQDAAENAWMDSLSKLPVSANSYDSSVASSQEMKTIRFREDNVHDFGWFADKRWVVRRDSVVCPGNDKLVYTWTAFLPSYQKTWQKGNDYLKETVLHYGKWVGAYPYNTIKAALGDMRSGGGMEYPTVTLVDKSANSNLKTVIIHEAGHNWFYGMLGSNERDHAWMDEGLNTFYEKKTNEALPAERGIVAKVGKLNEDLLYYEFAATHNDQAIDITSAEFSKMNYGIDVYYKSSLMLKLLEQYMGPEQFERGMKYYFESWHFKHPMPADFRSCMQKHTDKSLDWFFDGMLHTENRIDFTITNAKVEGNQTIVKLRNNSKLLSPLRVNAYRGDSLLASGWADPFLKTATLNLPVTDWTKLKIDKFAPDAKSANDVYRRHGLSHRFALDIKPYAGLNLSEYEKLFIAPALGNNQYDGHMLGVLFHDLTFPQNRFRFAVAPMYAFGSNSITGVGSAGYVWYPSGAIKEIMLQADAKTFHNNETRVGLSDPLYSRYTKAAGSLLFSFRPESHLSTVTRTLTLKGYSITEDAFSFGAETKTVATQKAYGLARYEHLNDRTYNPFSYRGEAQAGADFAKLTLEGTARVDYNAKNKALHVRAFLGKFLAIGSDPAQYDRYLLNASYSGLNDYLYDGTFLGRNASNTLGAQQISIQEGGFKVPVFNMANRSDNWMATLNLATDLPLKNWPVRLFFDAGLIPNFKPTQEHNRSTTLLYDGGVEVYLINNFVSIYIPIIMSSDFQNYLKDTYGSKSFAHGVSFTFQLQNINWLKTPTKALKAVVN